ncbi:unnamed protein product [Miscanthus lutarioriparius]|uniref:Uncharacterized protein n=1 Tax=Miscanthus lutarioriparius TaxID=422564 RepID=A0A811Q1D0_9POAL|nr:unnamed protein product [Miscanthus lutarioriparius]
MGDAQAPGGYFVGRPANYEEKPQDAADAQNRGSTPPGDYYVGHPVTYTAPGTKQALQVAAGGEQTPVSTQTPGATHNYNYYVGHPVSPEKTLQPAQPEPAPSPPPADRKRPSLLARW